MTKVLVTGGCGFIGHYLVKHLLKNDYQVSVFDNQARVELTCRLKWKENAGAIWDNRSGLQ